MAIVDSGLEATNKSIAEIISEEQLDIASSTAKENAWIRLMTYLGWYPQTMPTEEKSLVLKLDLSILVFGCLSFFTKYLDQASITNAYVRLVAKFSSGKGPDQSGRVNVYPH